MTDQTQRRLNVLLTTEGTYPHTVGGVSTWCQTLIEELPDVEFTVFAHMMNPFVRESYKRPANADLIQVPIWGVDEPAEFNPKMSPRRVLMLSALMDEETARRDFCPLLRPMLEMITDPGRFDPGAFGRIVFDIHLYFRDHSYHETFRTRAVWELFREVMLRSYGLDPRDEMWEDVDPEAQPSPQEIVQRLGELRRGVSEVDPDLTRNHRVPRLFEATEAMRLVYRLLTPLNYEMPEADVVHATAASFSGLVGVVKKLESGTPFLVTEHGVYMREQMLFLGRIGFPYHLRRFFIQFVSAISRTVYHYADQISPVCNYNARWERKNGATEEQIQVIYNGVDPERFKPRDVERSPEPTIVMVSRVDPLKDLETALRVAVLVRQRIPNVRFQHFGPSPDAVYNAKCQKLWKELRLEGTFEWMGATRDVPGAYNKGDVSLLTSVSEAFPYAVIEAMMCGLPVVSTDVGGVPEAVDDLGITARIRDVEALAEGVVRLLQLSDDAKAQLSSACRERTVELFTVGDSIAAYRRSYLMLSDRGRRPQDAPDLAPMVSQEPVILPAPVMLPVPLEVPAATFAPPAASAIWSAPEQQPVGESVIDIMAPLTVADAPAATRRTARAGGPAARDVSTSEFLSATTRGDVLQLLATPDSSRRIAGIRHHQLLGTNDAVKHLSQLSRRDPDAEVRAAAVDALATLYSNDVEVG